MSREAMKLALEALMRSRKAVSGDLDLAGCAYGKNDPDGHRYDDAKQALVTLDKAITALREALAEQPAQQALDRMAENARELGLDYESAQQEPVAWMYPDDYERMTTSETFCTVYSVEVGSATRGETTVALYTTPQPAQRTWVGLTDDEIYFVLENLQVMHHRPPTTDSRVIFALAIEAKLRSKNEDRN